MKMNGKNSGTAKIYYGWCNGLWRKGALCLEINTMSAFQPEPYSVDKRSLYRIKRKLIGLS